jgi:hypothetical protein
MSSVFISGSIAIKKLPQLVEMSLKKIIEQNIEVVVGDADGIDKTIQNYCKKMNYSNVTVYSIYSVPRNFIKGFKKKHISISIDSKSEREKQRVKDEAMTIETDYSFIIWDGKSKGSYQNALRALDYQKKIRIYLNQNNTFLMPKKVTENEIEFIYRDNNGYTAKEVVEYLQNEGEDFFQQTRSLNSCLLENQIIKKEAGIYSPMPKYENLFLIDKYRGKVKGIKFKNDFIEWVETWIKEIKPPQELSLF